MMNSMQGLKSHMMDMGGGQKGFSASKAASLLSAAIARHARHMDGSEPTSDASQQQLMSEMEAALSALTGEESMERM